MIRTRLLPDLDRAVSALDKAKLRRLAQQRAILFKEDSRAGLDRFEQLREEEFPK